MAPSESGGAALGTAAASDGHARRRSRTRAALVGAGVALLVEGRTDVAVAEIASRAGVAQGSFYNHFESKDDLFAAALEATMTLYGEVRDTLVAHIEDPAEVYAASFRVTARLVGYNPSLARLMVHTGTAMLGHPAGLRPRAIKDITAAAAEGTFQIAEPEIAFLGAASMMLGAAKLLVAHPERDPDEVADLFTVMSLRSLGCREDAVAAFMARPLPAVPDLADLAGLTRAH